MSRCIILTNRLIIGTIACLQRSHTTQLEDTVAHGFNNPKIVQMNDRRGFLAPFIDQVTRELEGPKNYYQGKSLLSTLYLALLQFFYNLRVDHSEEGVKKATQALNLVFFAQMAKLQTPPLNNPSTEDLLSLARQAQEAAGKIRELQRDTQDLSNRAFGAETALEQRERDILTLRAALERLKAEHSDKSETLQGVVGPLIATAEKEIEFLQRVSNTIHGMQSSTAAALTRLTESFQQKRLTTQSGVEAIDVTSEITRRATWLVENEERLQQLGELKLRLENQITEQEQMVRYADADNSQAAKLKKLLKKLSSEIQKYLHQKEEVSRQLKRFQTYEKSVEVVRAGIPAELVNQVLPPLPKVEDDPVAEVAEADDVSAGEDLARLLSKPSAVIDTGTISERRAQLNEIAEIAELTPNAVLIVSLYECLGVGIRRAMGGLLGAADNSGILATFGFGNPKEIWESWREDQTDIPYLKYRGTIPTSHAVIYQRTAETLPWNIRQLLTPEEVERFLQAMPRKATE